MRTLTALGLLAMGIHPVFAQPVDLNSHPVVELSDLVVAMLPANGFKTMDWNYLADSPLISWSPREPNSRWIHREGRVRVTVGEVTSKVMRNGWAELPWTVALWTTEEQKSEPGRIEIKPGGSDPDDICFGTRFQGCTFSDKKALSSAALKSRLLCRSEVVGRIVHAYSVSLPGKKPSMLIYERNLQAVTVVQQHG